MGTVTVASNNAISRGRATFSVVIPTYQRERTVGRAVESAIAQTFPAEEIIVVDDGSTDNTQNLIRTFPSVRYVRQEQAGSAAARNRGVQEACANWIAFLDSDDWWESDHLERIASAIEATRGEADLYFDDTGAVMHTFDGDGDGLHVGSLWEMADFSPGGTFALVPDASDWVLMPKQPMMLQSSVIRRESYVEVGGLWNLLPLRHDTHLFLRLGLGRAACAVSGIGVRMTDEGGDDRLTLRVTPSSRSYWDETVLLYSDVVQATRRGSVARRVLAERAASGYWRRARLQMSSRQPLAAMGSVARCIMMKPRFFVGRFPALVTKIAVLAKVALKG